MSAGEQRRLNVHEEKQRYTNGERLTPRTVRKHLGYKEGGTEQDKGRLKHRQNDIKVSIDG